MNKRTLLAFAFSFLILVLYPVYIKMITPDADVRPDGEIHTELDVSEGSTLVAEPSLVETAVKKDVSAAIKEEPIDEKLFELTNEHIRAELSNIGAGIISVALQEYTVSTDSEELVYIYSTNEAGSDEVLGAVRVQVDGQFLNIFNTLTYKVLPSEDHNVISFQSSANGGLIITKTYSLRPDEFVIDLSIDVQNASEQAKNVTIEVYSGIDYDSESKYNRHFTDAVIKSHNEFEKASLNKIKKGFSFQGHIDWVTCEDKYFAVILKPSFEANDVRVINLNNSKINSYMQSTQRLVAPGATASHSLFMYSGPKLDSVLSSYDEGFQNVLYRGFLWWLKKLVLILLGFFYKFFNNYGFAIIALTVLIKIVLTPLTHQSFQSMKKMQELQPQMKALQEKHKDNPQQLNKEVMELYKKHKANPLGGCWPMFLQLPIFIALYRTLSQAVELRGAPFIFWIKDLSVPDKMLDHPMGLPFDINILPILMIVSMVMQQKMTPSAVSKEQERTMMLMPLVFGVMFYNLPSGLVLYWFVSNVLTIGHQYFMRKKAA